MNFKPSICGHGTVWLASSPRAVTPSRSAVVRSRSIATEATTGTIIIVHAAGPSSGTNTRMLSARNPEAKWAMGEILMTVAEVSGLGVSAAGITASSHWPAAARRGREI